MIFIFVIIVLVIMLKGICNIEISESDLYTALIQLSFYLFGIDSINHARDLHFAIQSFRFRFRDIINFIFFMGDTFFFYIIFIIFNICLLYFIIKFLDLLYIIFNFFYEKICLNWLNRFFSFEEDYKKLTINDYISEFFFIVLKYLIGDIKNYNKIKIKFNNGFEHIFISIYLYFFLYIFNLFFTLFFCKIWFNIYVYINLFFFFKIFLIFNIIVIYIIYLYLSDLDDFIENESYFFIYLFSFFFFFFFFII